MKNTFDTSFSMYIKPLHSLSVVLKLVNEKLIEPWQAGSYCLL